MRAYYFDGLPGDQTLPNDSGISLAAIGVILWHIPTPVSVVSAYNAVDTIARDRGYKTIETMTVTKESFGDHYEEQLEIFYSEFYTRVHEDEEIRYILEGGGFFDVHKEEKATNRWIRLVVNAGDLVLPPAGIYHRFTLDERDMIKDRLKWVPHYRDEAVDNNPCGAKYIGSIAVN